MGNRMFSFAGGPESKRLKDAAPNLFHPTASTLLRKPYFSYYDTVSRAEGKGEGLWVIQERRDHAKKNGR